MDIEIDAYGKRVTVSGIECEIIEDCVEVVRTLWNDVEKPAGVTKTSEADLPPTLEAAGGGHAERAYSPMGYSYLTDGERLNVK